MKPWHKIPGAVVLAGMQLRLSEDRAASEVEAIAEMHALEETGRLASMSFLALANHLRWNRHRLRAALASWGKLAATMPDQQGVVPSMALPKPDNFLTTDRQQHDNSTTTTRQRRALFKASFRVATDNNTTTLRQQPDNSPTASCARASSSCREEDRDGELTTRASTTEPALFAETVAPAPPAKRRKTKPTGPADEEVVAACAPAWRAIRGLTGSETPKATDQKAILALWRGVRSDYTDPSSFGEDLLLVAKWAHSDDPDARNNIQGLRPNGTRWGADRSRDVATITRQDRWADRLAKARQSAQAASKAVATATPSFWELDAAARDPARIAAERKRVADQRAREEAEDRAEILRRANVLPLPDRARA